MSNVKSLVKKIDALLALVEEKQRSLAAAKRVVVLLPIKDDEPPVAYEIQHSSYRAIFYVPEERMNQSA